MLLGFHPAGRQRAPAKEATRDHSRRPNAISPPRENFAFFARVNSGDIRRCSSNQRRQFCFVEHPREQDAHGTRTVHRA